MLFRIRKYLGFIVLILISFVPLIGLFHPGLPLTHDGQDHVARIANFYQSLTEGNIIPRWAGNLNWGYGHPILMFLYPLPSYLTSLVHFLGVGLVDSLKIVFALGFIFSGLTMYVWIREFLGEEAGVLAGTLYMFAPYRFVDFYVRGAIGEHIAFIFPPLILYFMLKLSKKYITKDFILCSFSVAGLIISHNAITVIFAPFIFGYLLFLLLSNKNRKRLLIHLISSLLLGVGLSAFFLIPAFMEGKYTLRDIVTANEYASRFVIPSSLLYSPWSYGITGQFSVQIGLVQILGVAASILWFVKTPKKSPFKKLYIFAFAVFLLSIFIMVKESEVIWKLFTILQKFQFPWRFLSLTVFASALISSFSILLVPQKRRVFVVLFVVAILIIINFNYAKPKGFLTKPESFYTTVYDGTTDTGESSPIWSVRFMEHRPPSHIQILTGVGKLQEISRTSTDHLYAANITSEKARIVENTLYFPGWNVYVNNKKTDVEFQDPANRGLITFFVSEGLNKIELKFEDTGVRRLSNFVTLTSLIGVFVVSFIFRKYGRAR